MAERTHALAWFEDPTLKDVYPNGIVATNQSTFENSRLDSAAEW